MHSSTSVAAVFLLISGLLGVMLCFGLAAILGVAALFNFGSADLDAVPVFVFAGVGALGLPLMWHAGRRLRHGPPRLWKLGRAGLIVGLLVVVVSVGVGQAALSLNVAPDIVVGVAQFLAVLASAAVVLALTSLGWAGFSRLRAWGHFISGAWLAVGVSFVLEVFVVAVLAVLGMALLTVLAPAEIREVTRLARIFQATENPEALSELLYKPWLIGGVLVTVAVLLPLLEELIKPVGVMLTLGRRPGPMAAFLGGALGGAGFAVVESLLNLSTRQEAWAVLILARSGTTIMHALTTGLVGWGLGQLMATRRPWWPLAAYAGAVAIHGLWNASAVGLAFGGGVLLDQMETLGPFSPRAVVLAALVGLSALTLVGLTVTGAAALAAIGYRLRQQESPLAVS